MSTAAQENSTTWTRALRTVAVVYVLLVFFGLVRGDSPEQIFAYLVVVSAAVLPSVLWLQMGAPGIPVFPVVSLAYIAYFAWPALRDNANTQAYTLPEIAQSGVTVALYLIVATAAWRLVAGIMRATTASDSDRADPARAVGFVLAGIFVGCIFHIASFIGWLDALGSWFGLVRSVAITFVTVSCFLLGVAQARGILSDHAKIAAYAGLGVITVMAWSSLFLVGGMIYLLATIMGYVFVSKRIPVLAIGMVIAVVGILHAGKADMREKYWLPDTNSSAAMSIAEVPLLMGEWISEGISGILTGSAEGTVVDRASLIQMILLVQSLTPEQIDFLGGETYALLPSILVPRFIESGKPASQVGMDLLNIRYEVLTAEGTTTTAVGWGLIAEAFANFGYWGIVGMAILVGVFCGALAVWSAHAEITSIPTLASIAAMMVMANVEADFIQLASTLMQSLAAVLIFSTLYRWYAVPRTAPPETEAASDSTAGW